MSSGPNPIVAGLLAVNTGSSSVKLAIYRNDAAMTELCRATVAPVGAADCRMRLSSGGHPTVDEPVEAANHRSALLQALDCIERSPGCTVEAIGHRVVHGGRRHLAPERISAALLSDLRSLLPIDPDHLPQAIEVIEATTERYPAAPQFACFDTAFHRTMPPEARSYPLPRWTVEAGVQRYGFHGLSCEYIVNRMAVIDPQRLGGRLLIAHLGSGASLTAVERGASVDTTMGFSPTGGLMMGTRSGDLDPTVLTYLARTAHRDPESLDRLVNHESGLLGVSGLSGDVRDLLAATGSQAARAAIDLFGYIACKHAGALAAVLNGLDTIVFTGGIGEHVPVVREQICQRLGYLGVRLDPGQNAANRDVISVENAAVTVRVIATDEEHVIATHVRHLLA